MIDRSYERPAEGTMQSILYDAAVIADRGDDAALSPCCWEGRTVAR